MDSNSIQKGARSAADDLRDAPFMRALLRALHVPHTTEYSNRRFATMPFMTLFGLSKLLAEYGVDSQGVRLEDKCQAHNLPVPFVAPVRAGTWVIVTRSGDGWVEYLSRGVTRRATCLQFSRGWSGVALLMHKKDGAREPGYSAHVLARVMTGVRNWGIIALALLLMAFYWVVNCSWTNGWMWGLLVANCLGIAASFMLAQKTVGVHTRAADSVCAAIQEHGCDHVLETGGTFLGIFHWSEVGLGYFSVSLCALVFFPATLPWLAVFNACCLPYTVFSVLYQKFKAKAWCTLCLTVQATLWILAVLYLCSGAWKQLHGLDMTPVVLAAVYVLVTLMLNRLMALIAPENGK